MIDIKRTINDLRKTLNDNTGKDDYYVSQEIQQKRLNICKECEHHNIKLGVCMLCGCFLKEKTAKRKSICPMHKWLAE